MTKLTSYGYKCCQLFSEFFLYRKYEFGIFVIYKISININECIRVGSIRAFIIVTEAIWKLCHDVKVKEYCFLLFGLRLYTECQIYEKMWGGVFFINISTCWKILLFWVNISKIARKMEHGEKRITLIYVCRCSCLYIHICICGNIYKKFGRKKTVVLQVIFFARNVLFSPRHYCWHLCLNKNDLSFST